MRGTGAAPSREAGCRPAPPGGGVGGGSGRGVPAPAPAGGQGELPHALTFFLTGGQRAAVVRALRRIDRDRVRALLRALGVE